MEAVPPKIGGYWHDFGHAYTTELAGVISHEEILRRYSHRMIGMHVHDVNGLHDHGPLTYRTIDYKRLLPLVPPSVITVLEVHDSANADELVSSREILEEMQSAK